MNYRLRLLVTPTWLCQGFLSEMVLITQEKYPACPWASSRRSRASGSNTNLTWVSASGSGSTPGPAAPGWSGWRCPGTACSGTQSTQHPGQEHDWCGHHNKINIFTEWKVMENLLRSIAQRLHTMHSKYSRASILSSEIFLRSKASQKWKHTGF